MNDKVRNLYIFDMDNKNIMKKDDDLKRLFSETKLEASANLKYRIMHQIETEQALSRKQAKSRPVIGSMLSIFGVMYALIAILAVGIYVTMGSEALMSKLFFIPLIFISSICGLYWLITVFDEKRKVNGR